MNNPRTNANLSSRQSVATRDLKKYRKIRDLSRTFEMTKYANFLYKFLYRTHVKYKIEQNYIKGC